MHDNRRLNILWLSHFVPYPPKGGMLLRSYNLLREVALVHDVDVLAFIQKKPLQTMFPTVECGIEEATNHLLGFCKSIEYFDIPCENSRFGNHLLALKSLFTAAPYTINWLKSSEFVARIKQIADGKKYDVVHFDTISLAYVANLLGATPKVLNHHNIESHMLLRRIAKEQNVAKKIYFKIEGLKLGRYEKQLCPTFDVNITCSALDSLRLAEMITGLHIETISNGVDIEYFKSSEKSNLEPNSLIFVGGLNWYPNAAAMHYFADEIWPLLKRRCPDVVMNVIGQDPTPKIKALAIEDPHFRVHGFVNDIRPFMDAAAVYVCPIQDGGGTKLKILDSMAMQKAIVADEVACEGIDVVNGEHVLFAHSPEEYVDAIIKLLESPELRDKLGQNARQLVCDCYSYKELGAKLGRIYENILTNQA